MCTCVSVYEFMNMCAVPTESGRGHWSPGAGLTDSGEPSNVGAGN